MINQHSINRLTSKKLYNDSYINFFTNIDNNLQDIDNNINTINNILKSNNFCKKLRKHIKDQYKIINNK